MSLFLGKIHYWLYNKIQWFESIEKEMVSLGKEKNLPVNEWTSDLYREFGMPTGGEPLENIIDTSNIHGWLQQKISNAESRHAALITKMLEADESIKSDLEKLFTQQGKEAAQNFNGDRVNTPEDMFNAMNDFILEGMPCDRVNEVVDSSDQEFVWKATMCLHTPYWENAKGDVKNFYELRENWIKAFVENLNPRYTYEKSEDGLQRITVK